MKEKKESRISVRIPRDSDLAKRIVAAVNKTGIDEPTLVLRCVEAAVAYIEENGEITLPLVVLPKSSIEKTKIPPAIIKRPGCAQPASATSMSRAVLHGANESEGEYRVRKQHQPPSKK